MVYPEPPRAQLQSLLKKLVEAQRGSRRKGITRGAAFPLSLHRCSQQIELFLDKIRLRAINCIMAIVLK